MRKYIFDIDGTLTEPHFGTPWEAVPLPKRIAYVNELYDEGATIYLMTARGFIRSIEKHPDNIETPAYNAPRTYTESHRRPSHPTSKLRYPTAWIKRACSGRRTRRSFRTPLRRPLEADALRTAPQTRSRA